MKKRHKLVPKFKNENEEREFWLTHEGGDYFDFSPGRKVTIEFDPTVEAPMRMISLRLPREMLNDLRVIANKKDIPYQSLIKVFLSDKILEDKRGHHGYGAGP